MRLLRQAGLLLKLTLLGWWRGSLTLRRRDVPPPRRATAILLRLMVLGGAALQAKNVAHMCSTLTGARQTTALALALLGTGGLAATYAAASKAPIVDGDPANKPTRFLEALPISAFAYTVDPLVTLLPLHVASAIVCASAGAGARGGLWGASLGVVFSLSCTLLGVGLMAMVRALWRSRPPARASRWLTGGSIFFSLVGIASPAISLVEALEALPLPTRPLARSLLAGGSPPLALSALLALGAAGVGMHALAERLGYDRGEVAVARRVRSPAPPSLATLDRLLARRQPGGWFAEALPPVLVAGLSGGYVYLLGHGREVLGEGGQPPVALLSAGLATFTAFMVSQMVTALSVADANRDAAARPFLSTLPIAPNAVLGSRTAGRTRWTLLVLAPAVLPMIATGAIAREIEPVWRALVLLSAGVLSTRTTVAVSFLRGTSPSVKTGRAVPQLETFLVMIPLLGAVAAPYFASAVVALSLLALVAHEARRSALESVRWLDDAEDFPRTTETWRAALVLAVFFAAQALSAMLLSPFLSSKAALAAATYVVSAAVLVLFGSYERREPGPVPFRIKHPGHLLAGLGAGALSAGLAALYLRLLGRLSIDLPPSPREDPRFAWLAAAVVLVAPLAEEYFFRGILQDALARERGARSPWLVVVASAFLFAAIHPPLSFPAVFVLGLLAAALFRRTGSVMPGVIAHAVHNAVALLL